MSQFHSTEMEVSALGAMLLSPRAADELADMLEVQHFYRPSHRLLFRAITDVLALGAEATFDAVREALVDRNCLADIGGEDYILHVCEYCASPGNSRYYGERIVELWYKRSIAELARKIESDDLDTGDIRKQLAEIDRSRNRSKAPKSGPLAQFLNGPDTRGVPSGISLIDQGTTCKGFPVGQTSMIVAGTKGGKTALMMQMALHAAFAGQRVIYASFADLDANGLGKRALRRLSGRGTEPVSGTREHEEYCDAVRRIRALPPEAFEVYDSSEDRQGRFMETFISWVEGRRESPDLVFVDYAQKLRSREVRAGDAFAQAEECSSLCKWLAARVGCAVVLGSQLTEGNNKAGTKDMTKGSRVWEEDAGLVLRVQILDEDAKVEAPYANIKDLAKLTLRYSRFGPSNQSVMARFLGERVGFEVLA